MAVFETPSQSPAQRVRAAHPGFGRVASAPGTWVLIGENVDHFGGVTLVGTAALRAAAAVSPRPDRVVSVSARGPLGQEFSAQLPFDEEPGDGLGRRWWGLVHTLVQRQVLPRDTAGMDITVESDVPVGAGLGALYAADAAIALALAGAHDDVDTAPFRARLAEICSHAMATYSSLPVLRARHSAALRGAEGVSVVDYADGSLTQAPHPSRHGVRVFSVAASLGAPFAKSREAIAAHRAFIDAACTNFGVASLRQLPDAPGRVAQWVEARRAAGDDTAPDPGTARRWVTFCESETLRSLAASKALRSRRANELFTLLNSASEAHSLATPDALVALARERGAVAARPAATGTSNAVIAFVPVQEADAFASSMAREYEVVEVAAGEPARLEG
ncbi:galactokinase family protein [Corynebacterium ureicelerivorans]|uniref:galactokinase family protein n=1 Tax=Corynebacterium ureicelerivorans TaxID=401472 RepID=UPI00264C5286|nr:galactokinase family protein [Corynebacterium ureicelerivorans]MDN8605095.1 galactokinase family protein [Corynebacterium ureicelerivorans]